MRYTTCTFEAKATSSRLAASGTCAYILEAAPAFPQSKAPAPLMIIYSLACASCKLDEGVCQVILLLPCDKGTWNTRPFPLGPQQQEA